VTQCQLVTLTAYHHQFDKFGLTKFTSNSAHFFCISSVTKILMVKKF